MKLRTLCTFASWLAVLPLGTGTAALETVASVSTQQTTSVAVPEKLAIHAGALIDVEAGKVLAGQWILVDGDRIVAIQSRMRQFGTAVVVARVVEGSSDDPNGQFVSARCMSACVFVLMGGKKRVVPSHSQVGIHRMFRDEFGPDPAGDRNRKFERMFASGSMVDIVSRYTGAMGISRDLIATAERVSPDDIHIVTPLELTRWRLGSPKL